MSDLTSFRDHAKAMSTADHKPDCLQWVNRPSAWNRLHAVLEHPAPTCPGCVTDADRALWARLTAEADAYLAREPEESLL